MNLKEQFQKSLRFRMTVLILLSVIPPMLVGIILLSSYAANILRQNAEDELAAKSNALADLVNKWEEDNTLALRNLSQQPSIISMDAKQQKPILEKMTGVYKNITVTTAAPNGKAVTSSSGTDNNNYSDREWFKGAIAGKDITRQTLVSKTTGTTRLCLSTPVKGPGQPPIKGVVASCTDLTEVAKGVGAIRVGQTGRAFVVDSQGTVIAHPDPKITAQLKDLSEYAPVQAVLKRQKGSLSFTDEGKAFLAHTVPLKNGWGVVIQQEEGEVLREAIVFGQIATALGAIAVLGVGALTWMLISRMIRPIAKLTDGAQALANGNLDHRVEIDRQDELGTLARSFNTMAAQLKELIEVQVKSAMARSEIEKGRQIQKDFLPDTLPELEGWDIATDFEPARQVAGDFYDVFHLGKDKVCFVVADVCDKGVGSALFMALFRSLIRAISKAQIEYSDEITALKNAVEFTNNYIATYHSRTNMFATMFCGLLDPATGTLHYINGGHESPIIVSAKGEKRFLKSTGPAVGMLAGMNFKVGQTELNPGDTLFAYTDGVPEAKSPASEFFTEKNIMTIMDRPIGTAKSLLETFEARLKEHISTADQFDDITMLAVKRKE